MPKSVSDLYRLRKDFSRIEKIVDIPNLIDVQKQSYENFLQMGASSDGRDELGLQSVFKSVFPIKDFNNTASLEFVSYSFEKPRYDVQECRQRGMTYEAPMKVVVRLVVWDNEGGEEAQTIRDVKEQEVYFGTIPLMTQNGTFIINGVERVIVSQLHRSPGVFFEHDKGKTHASGKLLYSARVIPYRGSWLDFEFDTKDLLYVRIDRRRKIPATVLLRALEMSVEEILDYFYENETIRVESKKFNLVINENTIGFRRASKDIKIPGEKEVLVKKDGKFTKRVLKRLEELKVKEFGIDKEELIGRVYAKDIVDESTGEVLAECNDVVTEENLDAVISAGVTEFQLLYIDNLNVGGYIRNTLLTDKVTSPDEAIIEIYKRLRPGDPSTLEAAKTLFENLFFNADRYDLSKVGRLKINHKFSFDVPLEQTTLRKEDILHITRYLCRLKDGFGSVDDIDHLGNRRVRAVGELLENQYRIGLVRMERAIKERMSLQEIETLMPNDLINAKPVSAVVKEFFGSSQLSQFMDQTNPLSEITHKRRLSALGPGGLTRDRAGFEVRDVHPTHYGRVCPIETPEGPNIGLITSLSAYARVNEYGFIETPYRLVKEGIVQDEVRYFTALDEEKHAIAQANAELDDNKRFVNEYISCRRDGEFTLVARDDVGLMDVSPNQLVSIAASMIPFLEHDDANRALMGSNMQRQAVPLLEGASPIVGTGMESVVARDSGVTVVAKRAGTIMTADASRIVIKADKVKKKETSSEIDIYNLIKYQRSNQNTCINQRVLVSPGMKVEAGDVIADGPSTDRGELALGKNLVVAFMPWGGYNFEDSILLSEKLSREDVLTSIHIEEFECVARDTKLGKEEITRDIPNVGEEALRNLDETGLIRIGAEVRAGDILVGKITPKGETQLSPEEKLLRAIFGEKAGDVKDTSLRVGPGVVGTVIATQIFSREGVELDDRAKDQQSQATKKLKKDQIDEIKAIQMSYDKQLRQLLIGQTASATIVNENEKAVLQGGKKITNDILNKVAISHWKNISVEDEEVEEQIEEMFDDMEDQIDMVAMMYDQKVSKLKKGDDLPPGVIKLVKVYIAIKRKIMVGDKMAGRHGNKGVVSMILPEEDMPYLEDGTPVDIVLNPLGVPSRMNIGQILETHLGWAGLRVGQRLERMVERSFNRDKAIEVLNLVYKGNQQFIDKINGMDDKELIAFCRDVKDGIRFATNVFDGANEGEIKELLECAGEDSSGQSLLFDGRTGEAFENSVTVGVMYMLKLHHLVDDKIHARSIGPYSLVTQQPLGGKAQFGGQRLGEMEVWALEAYGAAYSLQEFLTVKSDDVVGRTRMYERVVKGDHTLEPGLPESFKVLMKEMQGLCLNVELVEEK
ncbi:MAG: DNA-directed RNA polymerase subunit beta [Deltaproteobacteria bacterium]|nr:DNA-directed RNA polymerase subunit beta [Deltaproteobacteria bacterium]